jgi:ubiquinone/menaquinone biosynthesis C-methylase UbiE
VSDYYAKQLSAERLKRCYDLAPPRVQQYLEAEIAHVIERIGAADAVLELGCGYGRVLRRLIGRARRVVGIDTSQQSLALARELMPDERRCELHRMNALDLAFEDDSFDVVLCIQNGISAFGVDQRRLLAEALRVTRRSGRVLFSSYAARFWKPRLEWFRLQADHGLLGEIDEDATGNGVIVCTDGFCATTVGPDQFHALAADLGVEAEIAEIDQSSLFCEICVP